MVPADLRSLVSTNRKWFEGVHRESKDSLNGAERRLGVTLPESLKWLLSEFGYSSACGVASLDGSVEETLRCRSAIGLPKQYVILEDRGDAGVILLDTATPVGKVVWVGSHGVSHLAAGNAIEDIDEYPDFGLWVSACLEEAKEWGDG